VTAQSTIASTGWRPTPCPAAQHRTGRIFPACVARGARRAARRPSAPSLEVTSEEGSLPRRSSRQALVLAWRPSGQVGRRRAFLNAPDRPGKEGLPGEHVDHALDLRSAPIAAGGRRPGADRLQVLERVLDGRPLAVEAVTKAMREPSSSHHPHTFSISTFTSPPRRPRTRTAPVAARRHSAVVQEGRVAGRVDQVELVLAPRGVVQARADRALAAHSSGSMSKAESRRRPGRGGCSHRREEECVGDRRLAGAALPHAATCGVSSLPQLASVSVTLVHDAEPSRVRNSSTASMWWRPAMSEAKPPVARARAFGSFSLRIALDTRPPAR